MYNTLHEVSFQRLEMDQVSTFKEDSRSLLYSTTTSPFHMMAFPALDRLNTQRQLQLIQPY